MKLSTYIMQDETITKYNPQVFSVSSANITASQIVAVLTIMLRKFVNRS
jgi:hypothetical protein